MHKVGMMIPNRHTSPSLPLPASRSQEMTLPGQLHLSNWRYARPALKALTDDPFTPARPPWSGSAWLNSHHAKRRGTVLVPGTLPPKSMKLCRRSLSTFVSRRSPFFLFCFLISSPRPPPALFLHCSFSKDNRPSIFCPPWASTSSSFLVSLSFISPRVLRMSSVP